MTWIASNPPLLVQLVSITSLQRPPSHLYTDPSPSRLYKDKMYVFWAGRVQDSCRTRTFELCLCHHHLVCCRICSLRCNTYTVYIHYILCIYTFILFVQHKGVFILLTDKFNLICNFWGHKSSDIRLCLIADLLFVFSRLSLCDWPFGPELLSDKVFTRSFRGIFVKTLLVTSTASGSGNAWIIRSTMSHVLAFSSFLFGMVEESFVPSYLRKNLKRSSSSSPSPSRIFRRVSFAIVAPW